MVALCERQSEGHSYTGTYTQQFPHHLRLSVKGERWIIKQQRERATWVMLLSSLEPSAE